MSQIGESLPRRAGWAGERVRMVSGRREQARGAAQPSAPLVRGPGRLCPPLAIAKGKADQLLANPH